MDLNFEKLKFYSSSVKYYLTGTFISSIGDGMFDLAVSKLIFDKTGSVLGVGIIIIIRSVATFLLNFVAGYVADSFNPKKISILSDFIQAILILAYSFSLLFYDNGSAMLFFLMTVISCISPFFRAANFKLLPEIDRKDLSLIKLNSLRSSIKQGGLLIGSALVAPIIVFHMVSFSFLLNALSFIMSCYCTYQIVTLGSNNKSKVRLYEIYSSWFLLLKELFSKQKLLLLVIFTMFDYMTLNFMNLISIKYAEEMLHNSAYISLLDGGYAVGAMCSFILVNIWFSKCRFKNVSWIGILVQGLSIILMSYFHTVRTTLLLILVIGIFTGSSIAIFQTSLHKEIPKEFHGKISSVKDMLVSLGTLFIVPAFSHIANVNLSQGLLIFGIFQTVVALLLVYLCFSNYFLNIKIADN